MLEKILLVSLRRIVYKRLTSECQIGINRIELMQKMKDTIVAIYC